MKKNIDRILIMFGFLAMLIMIFFMCARGGKTEPFIRTYDLIQDAIIEPMKNFTDSIQDGTGNINADTITADTITAAQLNIINIDLTTISGTTAIYLNLDVTDTADIKDLSADTITALKIITGTLQVDTVVEHTIYYETTVIKADSMIVNGNVEVIGNIKADNVEIDTLQINNNIIGNYTIEYDSILNKVATDTAEWSNINGIPTIVYDSSSFALIENVNDSFNLKLNISDLPDTAYIDTHIQDNSIHFLQSEIDISESQINDLDKYTQLEVDNLLLNKADTPHIHNISDISNLTESLTVKLSNSDTSTIRDMAGTTNYETEVAEIYQAMVNISDTKLREVGDSVALLESSVMLLSDSVTLLEIRVNSVKDSIPANVSQLVNDSNFISYIDISDTINNKQDKIDTLYFTVLNDKELFADTSIINDTTLITDTGAFVIYGDSLGINLNNYSYSYEILFDTGTLAGTWGQTNLLVYRVKTGNGRIIFKSDIYNFPANTIEVSLFRRRN